MKLQIAFDFIDLDQSLGIAGATSPSADWLEVGTSLIKSAGIVAVHRFKGGFPKKEIVADMKILDAGERESRLACESGADIVVLEACASAGTVRGVVRVAHDLGKKVMYDLLGTADVIVAAKQGRELGADYLCFHKSTDERGIAGFTAEFKEVAQAAGLPLVVAGRINEENIAQVMSVGPETLIVGSAITQAKDPASAARRFGDIIHGNSPKGQSL